MVSVDTIGKQPKYEAASCGAHTIGGVKILCDGSRRPVRGARHQLKTSATGHMKARCPVCKRVMTVSRVLGIVEFPRHEPK
jgi:hypothetical protein